MSDFYTTTIDGTAQTRAGHIYKSPEDAKAQTLKLNGKALAMGLKVSYQTTTAEFEWLSGNEKIKAT